MEFSNHTTSIAATTARNGETSNATPHRKNAAQRNRSDSPYQGRTAQKDNPTQLIIKQAVDFLIQQIEAGKSETLAAYLTAMARFHNYSFGNIVAIARQRPTATRVAGFGRWKEMGRFVKRGERGIQILAPMIGYRRKNTDAVQNTDADGNVKQPAVLIGFRAVHVFDVAQTEGEDLPEFEHNITGEVGEQRDRLIDFLAQQNITLEFNERIAPALGVSYGGKIALHLPGKAGVCRRKQERISFCSPMRDWTIRYGGPGSNGMVRPCTHRSGSWIMKCGYAPKKEPAFVSLSRATLTPRFRRMVIREP